MAYFESLEEAYPLILHKIKEKSRHKQPILVAIDGRCGSGKSTLASKLQADLQCALLHMDDFFLQEYQRTEARYQEPGGNVDYERVEEVLKAYIKNGSCTYQVFDCEIWALGETKTLASSPILIVEGSYSCRPNLSKYMDYKIFMHVNPEVQIARIKKRNGEKKLVDFKERWIPLEEKYFTTFHIEKICDDMIDTSKGGADS
ncbi:MAG: AAA family ATPase [Solobacterium sp.]|nr:AAA family ATPase [Solobacterium sp.]